MPKITEKNVFRNPKYMNILRLIASYDESLEFKHIAYVLIGEDKLRESGYISSKTCKEIPRYLEKHKITDYTFFPLNEKVDRVKNPERLSECLSLLRGLGLIEKSGNKYKVGIFVKYLCWLFGDISILEAKMGDLRSDVCGKDHFPVAFMDSRIHVFSMDLGVNGFLRGKYKVKFDMVVDKLKEVLLELDQIRWEILSNELRGVAACEFNGVHDGFVDYFYGTRSDICVVLNTFESFAGVFSSFDKRLIS